MTDEADQFADYARDCREMVPRMADPEGKRQLMTLAEAWEELARAKSKPHRPK
jgi:hypothetical protein